MGFVKSSTGKVLVPRDELLRVLKERDLLIEEGLKRDAVYVRVSTHGQKKSGDLDRQIAEIMIRGTEHKIYDPLIIQDVGSGLNTERKGLLKLMEAAREREIGRIFITHPDRLTRFGFFYLERYFDLFDIQIICTSEKEEETPQEELVEDMMSLLASFSGKLYRLRKEDKKKICAQIENIPEE